MLLAPYLLQAGLLDLDLSLVAEIIAFLIMVAILARYAYPRIIAAAEARQRAVAAELEAAQMAHGEAEESLQQAQKRLDEARTQAEEVLAGASRSADQLREEHRSKAEADAKRIVDQAREELVAERQRALEAVRSEVAELVAGATERVIGESLDGARHKKLIDEAIKEVAAQRE